MNVCAVSAINENVLKHDATNSLINYVSFFFWWSDDELFFYLAIFPIQIDAWFLWLIISKVNYRIYMVVVSNTNERDCANRTIQLASSNWNFNLI